VKSLRAENKALRQQQSVSPDIEEMDQEVDRLTAKVGDLDLEKQNLADELAQVRAELEKVRSHKTDAPNFSLPDLTKLRDRTLAELKLGKQAPGYKSAQKVLDKFIEKLKNEN
jgi:hypothetical protein